MANFEDFLNDYDLDEPQEESLDLPELDTSADNSYAADFEPEYSDDNAGLSQQEEYYPDVDDGFSDDYSDDFDDGFETKPAKKPAAKQKVNLPSFSGIGKGLNSNAILGIVVAISIVLSLIAIISSAGVKKSVNKDIQTLYSQMDSVISTNSQVLDKLAVIEDVLNLSAQVSAETNSKYISITKQPTSVATTLGRGQDGIVPVFTITASGSGVGLGSFNWQKKSGDVWINIDFDSDNNSRNDLYGFQLEVSKDAESGGYSSKIWATGITSEAFGTYRCVITDSAGERAWSDIVEITRK